ncbi:uncharacterized protein UHO2_06259 [Ustilago hordei]|uniref:Reverse transcriptase Ty1/copia-type domain-containing protein n=1 Tax=Ustilago hordei TaxID=120017 RepID=I2FTJ7_USTHO|nr:uncharacterized protein UHO2_06259 [Ustilago hordei]CCF50240.1 uncharacterized protein UHOR_07814 [Ustilago hordei]SYW87042.1 uncharacterized protein UHO2_06259 [Ustilago hordei]
MFGAHKNNGKCYHLKKALYSLKQAGRLWNAALNKQLQAFRFRQSCAEPCIYTQGAKDAMIMLAIYIDDLLIIGATLSCIGSVRHQLSSIFSITDQGNVSHIIGMNVKYNCELQTLLNNQTGYIKGLLEKFGMHEAWSTQSPATEAINTMGLQQGDTANAEEIRHLKGKINISLVASQVSSKQVLMGWMDSDWVGSQECFHSTTGHKHLGHESKMSVMQPQTSQPRDQDERDAAQCSWSSQLQLTIANSSVKAKYVTLAATAREMLWISMFLRELGQSLPRTSSIHVTAETLTLHSCNQELILDTTIPILYSDLSEARVITNEPQHFKRTKHIDIAHFFLWDKVADG